MQSKSRTRKHGKYVSIGITIAVVIMMVLSGPVSAVSLGIAPGLDGSTHTKGASVSFDVTATIEDTDRYVPIDNFSLEITGATSKEVVFSTDGDVLSGSGITVDAVTVPSSTYGHGDGYGYDSGLGYGYDFGYGYGYGYGNGAGGEDVVYEYTITLDTSILNTGVHEAVLSLNTGDEAKPSFESSSATFTIKSKSSGGSSGGSGGGGSTGEAFENIAFKEVKTENIVGGLEISYTFDDEQNAIQYINFSALRNYGRVSTTIEVLKNKSAMVDESAPGVVYSNLNIWVGKSGFATEDNIADPAIGFSVAKAWLIENGIDENSIALYRHSEGKWNALNTMKVGEDDSYIYFEAETPGFSPFAITGEKKIVEIDDKTTSSEGATGTEDADANTSTEKSDSTVQNRIMAILSFAAIIALMGYVKRDDISKYLKKK